MKFIGLLCGFTAFVLSSCTVSRAPQTPGTGPSGPSVSGTSTPGDRAAVSVAPPNPDLLARLPACNPPPLPSEHEPVDGLLLPEDAAVTRVVAADPATNVFAYVAMTPPQVVASYQDRAGVEVLFGENETTDAEVLITTGDHRLFVKAVAVCDDGSRLAIVVASESAAGGGSVPSPRVSHSPGSAGPVGP